MSLDYRAIRDEGWHACRAGRKAETCPHSEGSWERAEWLVGHAAARGVVPKTLLRTAARLRERARHRRTRGEARLAREPRPSPPESTGNRCALPSCGGRIRWNPKMGKARNGRRLYCRVDHAREHAMLQANARREALWRSDPARARELERKTRAERKRRLDARGLPEPLRPPPEPVPPPHPRPRVVQIDLLRRLAAAGEHEDGMRVAGLSPDEIRLALALQRGGKRLPEVARA